MNVTCLGSWDKPLYVFTASQAWVLGVGINRAGVCPECEAVIRIFDYGGIGRHYPGGARLSGRGPGAFPRNWAVSA